MAPATESIAAVCCLSLVCACGGSGGRKLPDFATWADNGALAETLDAPDPSKADLTQPDVQSDTGPIAVSDRCFPDKDKDGYPIKGMSIKPDAPDEACPEGYTFLLTFDDGLLLDCDDLTFTTHPGAVEMCNLVDDDCDGLTDEGLDQPCTDNCGNPGQSLCEGGVWTPCSASGKVCCEGERKEIVPCPPFDFVFVTDNSGSMTESDPTDIRYQAVGVFIDHMDN
ncbi:MAG: hypothetical protein GXP54_07640, partial [Deltaproteobacteria bacterium]|nr:hypothetical protein [Deltaproteobacteria bacterium]